MVRKYIAIIFSVFVYSEAQVANAIEIFEPSIRTSGSPQTFRALVNQIVEIINLIVPVLISLALIGFLFGVTRYGFSQESEESKKTAKAIMFWGIIILFIMTSIWGILKILTNTFFGV